MKGRGWGFRGREGKKGDIKEDIVYFCYCKFIFIITTNLSMTIDKC